MRTEYAGNHRKPAQPTHILQHLLSDASSRIRLDYLVYDFQSRDVRQTGYLRRTWIRNSGTVWIHTDSNLSSSEFAIDTRSNTGSRSRSALAGLRRLNFLPSNCGKIEYSTVNMMFKPYLDEIRYTLETGVCVSSNREGGNSYFRPRGFVLSKLCST